MSILAALTRKWHYSVEHPGAGRLVYREGNREYTFPIYEENGLLKLVGVPSGQRIHFFFNWYWHPRDFSPTAGVRILPRIAAHLRASGARVQVISPGLGERGFKFHPELFELRGEVSDLLAAAGHDWFSDYASIDLLHAEFGLEITGIPRERDIKSILAALQSGFPHWHHVRICGPEDGGEPGWTVALSMFPLTTCVSGWQDES